MQTSLKVNEDGATVQKQVYKAIAEFLPKWKKVGVEETE